MFNFTFHTGKRTFFTDPKAAALLQAFRFGQVTREGGGNRLAPKPGVKSRGARELAELTARYDKSVDRKLNALKTKYGEDPFPDLTRQAEVILNAPHEEHDRSLLTDEQSRKEFDECEREERELLVRAEMERFVFGRVWPETEAEIAAVRGRLDELLEWPREGRLRAAEAERRRKEEEAAQFEKILRAFESQRP